LPRFSEISFRAPPPPSPQPQQQFIAIETGAIRVARGRRGFAADFCCRRESVADPEIAKRRVNAWRAPSRNMASQRNAVFLL